MGLSGLKNVVFFDSDCMFCNSSVNFVRKFDRKKGLFFAPLHGKTADLFFSADYSTQLRNSSIWFWDGTQLKSKSDAVFAILDFFPIYFKLFYVFKLIPEKTLNYVYDKIANNRYFLNRTNFKCSLPLNDEKSRFMP